MTFQTVNHEFSSAPAVPNWQSESNALDNDDDTAYTNAFTADRLVLKNLTNKVVNNPGEDWIPIGIKAYVKVGIYDGSIYPTLPEHVMRVRLTLSKNAGLSIGDSFLVDAKAGIPWVQRDAGNNRTIWGLGDLSLEEINDENFSLCFSIPIEEIDETVSYLPVRSVSYAYIAVTYVDRMSGTVLLEADGDCSGDVGLTVTEE